MLKIWESYFLGQFIKTFLFVLFGFFGLYALIDYANHSASFHHYHIHFQWTELASYYFWQLAYRADILVPFAVLIAAIKTLCSLNTHNELVALLASGVKLHRLLLPFLLLGFGLTFLLYLNTEAVAPYALQKIKRMEFQKKSDARQKKALPAAAQGLTLKDGTTLLYNRYDAGKKVFFDAYWIRSPDDIYKIKFLYLGDPLPWGEFVDYMTRDKEGNLISTVSARSLEFPTMQLTPESLKETTAEPEELPLTTLWGQMPPGLSCQSEKECEIASTFYYKMAMPWLCLLAIMGPAPWCIAFTRTLPTFFIYASSTFALISFYLVMQSALILGERQLAAPLTAIGLPFLLFLVPIVYFYVRGGR